MTTFYCLVRKSDDYIFYVGITKDPTGRLRQHKYSNPVRDFIKNGNVEMEMVILHIREIKDWQDARIESYYIAFFQDWKFQLLNRNNFLTRPLHKINLRIAFSRVTEDITNQAFKLVEKYFFK